MSQQNSVQPQMVPETHRQLLMMERRLKLIEESLANLRRAEQLNERNTISINKQVSEQLREFNYNIETFRKDIAEIKTEIRTIISELQSTAKSEEVLMLKKYINMLNPLHFVTQQEIDGIVEDKVQQILERRARQN